MMTIFPTDKISFTLELSKGQIAERLKERIDNNDTDNVKRKRAKKYFGRIQDNEIEIRRKIIYRNSFQPIIKGKIEERNNKTHIDIKLLLSRSVKVFFMIWCIMASFAFILVLRSSLLESSFDPIMLLTLFSILFIYGIIYIGYKYESTVSIEDLKKIINEINSC